MVNVAMYEFYPPLKAPPTAKLRKAIDKVLPDKSIDKLIKLGVKEIKLTSVNELKKKVKNKEPI